MDAGSGRGSPSGISGCEGYERQSAGFAMGDRFSRTAVALLPTILWQQNPSQPIARFHCCLFTQLNRGSLISRGSTQVRRRSVTLWGERQRFCRQIFWDCLTKIEFKMVVDTTRLDSISLVNSTTQRGNVSCEKQFAC